MYIHLLLFQVIAEAAAAACAVNATPTQMRAQTAETISHLSNNVSPAISASTPTDIKGNFKLNFASI
jgi:hypothetical protein